MTLGQRHNLRKNAYESLGRLRHIQVILLIDNFAHYKGRAFASKHLVYRDRDVL
jgi:hypothetical protein